MDYRKLIPVLLLVIGAAWWLLHSDPEAEVREAHEELRLLLQKADDASNTDAILNARVLRDLFADPVAVSGSADRLAGSYLPEEMVRTIVGVQGRFQTIDLTFSEVIIEFPARDDAIANFSAVLEGSSAIASEDDFIESRDVISRMREIDGRWRFSEFRLTEAD